MRRAFIAELCGMAEHDERIWLLTGDVGYNVVEPFLERFGRSKGYAHRFVNCGIAEQNMMLTAAGMAHEGLKPWVYSMGNFVTLRCFDQVRLIDQHHLGVTIVGVGGGKMYEDWPSHRSVIDDAAMRLLPNMGVHVPKSPEELVAVMRSLPEGPNYLKVGEQ